MLIKETKYYQGKPNTTWKIWSRLEMLRFTLSSKVRVFFRRLSYFLGRTIKRILFYPKYRRIIKLRDNGDTKYWYIAIYRTKFLINEMAPFSIGNVIVEVTRRKRGFMIPTRWKIFIPYYEAYQLNGSHFAQKQTILEFGNDNHNYIYAKAFYDSTLIKEPELESMNVLKEKAERDIGYAITLLSQVFSSESVFSDRLYFGPWVRNNRYNPHVPELHLGNEFEVNSLELINQIQHMEMIIDDEKLVLIKRMSSYYQKALELPNGEIKFIMLWIMLEVYPMKESISPKPIREVLSKITGYDNEEIEISLQIGKLYGLRSDILHTGKQVSSTIDFLNRINSLHNICQVILKHLLGLDYDGILNKYFSPTFRFDGTTHMDWIFDKKNFVPTPVSEDGLIGWNFGGLNFGFATKEKIEEIEKDQKDTQQNGIQQFFVRHCCEEGQTDKVMTAKELENFSREFFINFFATKNIGVSQPIEIRNNAAIYHLDSKLNPPLLIQLFTLISPNHIWNQNNLDKIRQLRKIAKKNNLLPLIYGQSFACCGTVENNVILKGNDFWISCEGPYEIDV